MYRASHILIAYQGAQRATSQRIQEEALFEAGRIQQEILSKMGVEDPKRTITKMINGETKANPKKIQNTTRTIEESKS